jgi:hypothetical protein
MLPAAPASASDDAPAADRFWRVAFAILALYLVSRLMLVAVGIMGKETVGDGIDEPLARMFCRWDCDWYLWLVTKGYTTSSADGAPGMTSYAFFPLFPLLARGLTALGLSPVAAVVALANLCFVAALFYVQRYARLLGLSTAASLVAVALLCFVPHGFVFSAGYTESLFLLLLVAAMYHMRREHYLLAGLAAAALSGVRANGVFFLVFALALILRRFGWRALLAPWRRPEVFVPVVLAPLGLFAFWAFCFYGTGDAFAQMSSIEQGWQWRSAAPWKNIARHLVDGNAAARFWVVCSLCVAALSLLLLRRRRYEEFFLVAAILCLLWSGQIANSLLRYCIVLFPVWIALAQELERRPLALAATVGGFALVNGWLMVAWTVGAFISI